MNLFLVATMTNRVIFQIIDSLMESMQVRLTWCGCKYVTYRPSASQFKWHKDLPVSELQLWKILDVKILHVVLVLSTTCM